MLAVCHDVLGGIKYIRIHNLLFLITVPDQSDPSSLTAQDFNFSRLDKLLDLVVVDFGFAVGFEIMGNPLFEGNMSSNVGVFTSWKSVAQVVSWKIMVRTLAEHMIGRCMKNISQPTWFLLELVRARVALTYCRKWLISMFTVMIRYGIDRVSQWRWEAWNEYCFSLCFISIVVLFIFCCQPLIFAFGSPVEDFWHILARLVYLQRNL